MNAMEKRRLSEEAKMQMAALKKIQHWKAIALCVSAIGVAAVYTGLFRETQNLFLGIPGIAAVLTGSICAIVLNLGIKNGRRNVGKILDVLEQ